MSDEVRQKILDRLYETQKVLTSPRQRAIMNVFIDHIEAETGKFDLERAMHTLVDHPVYSFYGTDQVAEKHLEGQEAIRNLYSGYAEVLPRQESFADRIIVGDDAIVFEGYIEIGPELANAMAPEVKAEPGRDYVVRKQLCVIVPFDESAKMTGEISYFDGPFTQEDIIYLDN